MYPNPLRVSPPRTIIQKDITRRDGQEETDGVSGPERPASKRLACTTNKISPFSDNQTQLTSELLRHQIKPSYRHGKCGAGGVELTNSLNIYHYSEFAPSA
jgi:hypothetical protein